MTELPNPFTSFADSTPCAAETAAASSPSAPLSDAAADHVSNSCGGGESRPASIGPQASASRRSKDLIGEAGVATSPQEYRFVLDVDRFMADLDPAPLFLRAPSPEFICATNLMPVLQVLAGY